MTQEEIKALSDREWRALIRKSLPEIDVAWIKKHATALESMIKTNTMQNREAPPSEFHNLEINCKPGFRFEKYYLGTSGMPGHTKGFYIGAFSIFAYEGLDQHNVDFAIKMGQRIFEAGQFEIDDESVEFAWSGGGGQKHALNLMHQFVKEIADAFIMEQSDKALDEADEIGIGVRHSGPFDPKETL